MYVSFMSVRAGSRVFALIMLFHCVILDTMWSDESLQLLCILPFGILYLSAINDTNVSENYIGSVYVALYCSLDSVFYVNCVQSAFLQFVNVRRFCCSL